MSILVLQSSKWGGESWLLCLVCFPGVSFMVVWLFLAVPWVCLRFVIVVFPDHTHLLFLMSQLLCLCCVVTVKSFPVLTFNVSQNLHLTIIYCICFPIGIA